MAFKFTNNATAKLASSILSTDLALNVVTGQGAAFPTLSGGDKFRATLVKADGSAEEIIEVTARSTDALTIVRAKEGTTAADFAAGDSIKLLVTKEVMEALLQSGSAAGGDLTGAYPSPTLAATAVTAGSYGDASHSLAATVDAKGRLTALVANAIAVAASAITSGLLALARGGTNADLSATGGANQFLKQTSVGGAVTVATIAAADLPSTAVTPGSYGDGTHAGQFTVDAQGRVTAAASVTITGAAPTGSASGDLSGSYPGPTVAKANGNSVPATVAKGDLLAGSAASTLSKLAVGTDTFVLTADATQVTGMKWAAAAGGGSSRATVTKTTGSLASAATENSTVTLAKGGRLYYITADRACRVILYATTGARTADSGRAVGVPATAGAGILCEFVFTAAATIYCGPETGYYDGAGSPTGAIPYAITNSSGGTSTVQVQFTHLALET